MIVGVTIFWNKISISISRMAGNLQKTCQHPDGKANARSTNLDVKDEESSCRTLCSVRLERIAASALACNLSCLIWYNPQYELMWSTNGSTKHTLQARRYIDFGEHGRASSRPRRLAVFNVPPTCDRKGAKTISSV
jgi:hypothetical protein